MAPVAKKRRLNGRETPQQHDDETLNGRLDHDAHYSSSSEEEDPTMGRSGQSYGALVQSLSNGKPPKKLIPKAKPQKPNKSNVAINRNSSTNPSTIRSIPPKEAAVLPEEPDRQDDDSHEASDSQEDGLEDDEDPRDPFETHFASIDTENLASRIRDLDAGQLNTEKISVDNIGRITFQHPTCDSETLAGLRQKYKSSSSLSFKKKLGPIVSKRKPKFSHLESNVAPFLFSHTDLLFGDRRPENTASLRELTALHVLNHVMKTRDRVIKNNSRLQKEKDENYEPDLELRDQGFTRPKVLILLETRQMCARYVEDMIKFYEPEQQENKKRFLDAFNLDEVKYEPGSKPEDFRELFEGNDDNEFRIGLKLTRKNIKFYSQFYNSDIIFASPLGLRRAIDANDQKRKKRDYDFLSSIEIVVLDQVDAMAMQNWSHVTHALSHINLMPKSTHGCDFSRVRNWSLNGQSKYLRQTIVFSAYLTPEINALFSNYMSNAFGKVKIQPSYSGAILASASTPFGTRVKQTFQRYHSISASNDPDDRFEFFTSTVLPALARLVPSGNSNTSSSPGVLLFAPTYFDYTRLRNLFSPAATSTSIAATSLAETFSVAHLTEYSSASEASRAMSHFGAGRAHVLLYTGRAHHFRRYRRIRGVKRVVFYGLPDNPAFWGEMLEQVVRGIVEGKISEGEGDVRCLFSRWDGLALERIVGSERVGVMVKQESSKGDVFEFT